MVPAAVFFAGWARLVTLWVLPGVFFLDCFGVARTVFLGMVSARTVAVLVGPVFLAGFLFGAGGSAAIRRAGGPGSDLVWERNRTMMLAGKTKQRVYAKSWRSSYQNSGKSRVGLL